MTDTGGGASRPRVSAAPERTAASMMYETGLVTAPVSCHGCGGALPPKRRPGGPPRRWCSETCRVRTIQPYVPGVSHAPRSAVFVVDCARCEEAFIGRTSRARICQRCRPLAKAERQRARYAADPAGERERVQTARSSMTPDQRRTAQAARQEWKHRVGRIESIKAAEQRRRVRLAGGRVESFKPIEVFVRDGWVCGICHDPIDRNLRYPHQLSASLDHVLPVALGGEHTLENCRAAHLVCNVRRGARLDEAGSAHGVRVGAG